MNATIFFIQYIMKDFRDNNFDTKTTFFLSFYKNAKSNTRFGYHESFAIDQ